MLAAVLAATLNGPAKDRTATCTRKMDGIFRSMVIAPGRTKASVPLCPGVAIWSAAAAVNAALVPCFSKYDLSRSSEQADCEEGS